MDISTDYTAHPAEIAELFKVTFTASEGADEGTMVSDLARRLMADTTAHDLCGFLAREGDALVGAIFFSRMVYEGDTRLVFLLSPVAVATNRQGQGIGQMLISHGLGALRAEGAEIAVTYGDPNFYGRVGFKPAKVTDVPSPYTLQHPEGWLAQSLTGAPLAPIKGPANCVPAFANPALW